ncbi:MAG: hypothetical protein PHV37_02480 [Candidatus Gastranaerophilales bacterium]|nr:hypothetical protein [Candidatus Gastranaerophilales bacterium]
MVSSISSANSTLISQMLQNSAKEPEFNGTDMFSKLSSDLGTDGSTKITKDQLQQYIDELNSDESTDDKGKLGFLNQLIENFDTIAGEDGEISSEDMVNNADLLKPPTPPQDAKNGITSNQENLFSYITDWQIPSDVTKDQLESPIDILI